MDRETRLPELHRSDAESQDHLQRLQGQTARLTFMQLAFSSWSFEQKALAREKEWRRTHWGPDL